MHLEFITREGEPAPYDGPYQFQFMSDEEVEIYKPIVFETFKGIYDENELIDMIKSRVKI